jgi:hypothetical protein
MNKKAVEVSPPSIIVAIVIVVVILIIILFMLGREGTSFLDFLKNTRDSLLGNKCESSALGRHCGPVEGYTCTNIPPPAPSNKWDDCDSDCYECSANS